MISLPSARLLTLVVVAAAGATALSQTAAEAYYGMGAQIVSASFARLEQGDDSTTYATISGNGRYVAIQTRARNLFDDSDGDPSGSYRVGGIFRFDMETKALERVADGDLRGDVDGALITRGAQNPSISVDGSTIAFSTAAQLVPADTNDSIDVYIRNMNIAPSAPGAYELISARDGSDQPASYAPRVTPMPGRNPGTDVSRGIAISGDGSRVIFRTADVFTDLPSSAGLDTPEYQLFVRDRAAHSTTLVTRLSSGGGPAGGAIGPAGISSDGSTVAWTGQNGPAQTRLLLGESLDTSLSYYLWQRIDDGPTAPTRRITGLADPDDPACDPSLALITGPLVTGSCYGPLTDTEQGRSDILNLAPALSGDGKRVAFITAAGLRPTAVTGSLADLFVTDMSVGVSRKVGTLELTREGDPNDQGTSSPIDGLSMSSGGRWLAVATARTTYLLPALRFIGARRSVVGSRDLYVVDLDGLTVQRAALGRTGTDLNGDVASSVSISANGDRLAFTSTATNLIAGDANDRSDAFVVTRQAEPSESIVVPPPDPGPSEVPDITPPPTRLSVRATGRSDGTVVLAVAVPSSGGLAAVARRSTVKVVAGRKRTSIVTVASATAKPRRAGRLTLTLRPASQSSKRLLRSGKAISAKAVVSFISSQGKRLSRTVTVVFRVKAAKATASWAGWR